MQAFYMYMSLFLHLKLIDYFTYIDLKLHALN